MNLRQLVPLQGACPQVSTVEERVTIARPVDEVYRLLTHEETEWLQPFLRLAAHKGEKAGAELRARLASQAVVTAEQSRSIVVTIGRPTVLLEGAAIEIPLQLDTVGYRCVFPRFDGRLLVSRANDGRTYLSFVGTYRMPQPVTGNLDDTLVAQHAAQTAIRDLLENLCVAMESESSMKGMVEGSG